MKKILCGLVVSTFIFSSVAVAQKKTSFPIKSASNSVAAVHKHINDANHRFSEIVSSSPEKEIDVNVFFYNAVTLEQALHNVKVYQVRVKGFRHGTPENSGGYNIKDGESVEEATKQYRRDHEFFIKQDLIYIKKMMADQENDEVMRTALAARRKAVLQRQDDYAKNGLRIIGIEMQGKAKEIDHFRRNNTGTVRVIEVKEKGLPQPNMF